MSAVIVIVQGLKILLGSAEQPNQHPAIVSQNSDANLLLSFFDENSEPVDISGVTSLALSFLEDDGTTVLSYDLATGITLVNGRVNQALVAMKAADSALLPIGDNDAQVAITSNAVDYAINMYGVLTIQESVV